VRIASSRSETNFSTKWQGGPAATFGGANRASYSVVMHPR
jgi:hypothetical protein